MVVCNCGEKPACLRRWKGSRQTLWNLVHSIHGWLFPTHDTSCSGLSLPFWAVFASFFRYPNKICTWLCRNPYSWATRTIDPVRLFRRTAGDVEMDSEATSLCCKLYAVIFFAFYFNFSSGFRRNIVLIRVK